MLTQRKKSGPRVNWLLAGLIVVCFCLKPDRTCAQLADQWLGVWAGTMHIYKQKALVDSVPIRLTIARTDNPEKLVWRTEYLSVKQPMVKDYAFIVTDAAKGIYQTDEGGGTRLTDFLFDNKIYSVFEVQGILLTSTYELRQNELIFEVTSGKKLASETNGATSYSVNNLQRAVLKRSR